MNRAGEEFLAGSALAEKQYRGLTESGLPCLVYGLGHRLALPFDQTITSASLFRVKRHLGTEPGAFQRLVYHEHEMIGIEGFGDEIVGASFHGLNGAFNGPVGRDHDNGEIWVCLANLF